MKCRSICLGLALGPFLLISHSFWGQQATTGAPAGVPAHAFNKSQQRFCAANPGKNWHYFSMSDGQVLSSGHCPSEDDKEAAAANAFVARHKDFIQDQDNSHFLTTYLGTHNLDPREEKSYERAFKDLKKSRKLKLKPGDTEN